VIYRQELTGFTGYYAAAEDPVGVAPRSGPMLGVRYEIRLGGPAQFYARAAVVNFANGDMVGHTGVLKAAVEAVQHVDICVGKILDAINRQGGFAIVLADHGNCEQMIDPATGGPHTAHTTYPVELIVVDDRVKGRKLREGGRLADVAPTALELMGLPKPAEMTGVSLLAATTR
jgi:2,3-bisphosphoglycerate-independent phosphoglycerate mutase